MKISLNSSRSTFVALCTLAVTACVVGPVPTTTHPVEGALNQPLYVVEGGATLGVKPLTSEEEVREWFGYDITEFNIVPIYLEIENASDSSGSLLLLADTVCLGETDNDMVGADSTLKHRGMTPHEIAGARLRATAAALFGAFTLPPEVEHEAAQSRIQNRMAELSLQSNMLRPGSSTHGFLYFQAQPNWSERSQFMLEIKLMDTTDKVEHSIHIMIPQALSPFLPRH